MKEFKKSRNGPFAHLRWASEVEAYREADLFWTGHVPGWSHPRMLKAGQDCSLTVNRIPGPLCSWDSAVMLLNELVRASQYGAGCSQSLVLPIQLPTVTDTKHLSKAASVANEWSTSHSLPQFRINGDVHPGNVICHSPMCLVLIDWELSRHGFIVEDLGSFIAHSLIAAERGNVPDTLPTVLLKNASSAIPAAVIAAFTIIDLYWQSARERRLNNHLGANFRERIAAKLSSLLRIEGAVLTAPDRWRR